MCSFAVKTDAVRVAFTAIALVVAAAVQDMLPAFGGVKAPLLQTVALYAALRGGASPSGWVWTAAGAGAFSDALSGLPLGCGLGFLLPACAAARVLRGALADVPPVALGMAAAMIAAPLNEVWLAAWGLVSGAPATVRFFASALPAAVTGAAAFALLPRLEAAAGLTDEEAAA